MRKIRIQNDGEPAYMTRVYDAETGEPLEHVTRLKMVFDAADPEPPCALLYVARPAVDVILDADIRHVCPVCGRPTEEDK